MSRINNWAKASFSIFSGNVIEAFQPLDFFHFYGLWYDLWIKNILQTLNILKAEEKSYIELKNILSTPSNLRALIQKMIPAYLGTKNPNPEEYKRYFNFVARMLEESCPKDPFGKTSTPLHTTKEINEILQNTTWQIGTPENAKLLGRLLTAVGSLVHGLYNDVVTDFGWDAYGPYQIQNQALLIRHFPDMQPKELWASEYLASVKDIKIFGIYENVEWEISCFGCHTIVKNGNPILGLKKYAILSDNKYLNTSETQTLILELSEKAEKIYKKIRQKNFEELKKMVMLQECYQFKKLFDQANLNWLPTKEMDERIASKPLLTNILPRGTIVRTQKEYEEKFGLNKFAKEVLNETLT
jgi:hypothetical protein